MFKISRRPNVMLALIVSCVSLAGCWKSETGPRQFHVYGDVTYDGKPIPVGRISFVPKLGENSGPPGYAIIQRGKFDTRSKGGKPSISGPLEVLVTHYGEPNAEGALPETALFDDYKSELAIDSKNRITQMDLSIPLLPTKKKLRRK
ncbi:hypothetical protein [Planctomicrobium sp. SH527]|uniref:hypothetical protein n=1 Tax=Planctomicrobium sp. SH527 TaxID=3448123 RepID=UPI003F5B732A